MDNYEIMVIIKPDIGIDEIEKKVAEIKDSITGQKGEITFEDIWGVRDMAYAIKKYDRGYYMVMNFTYEGPKIKELDTNLKLDNSLIRHMIIRIPDNYTPKTYKEIEKEIEEREQEKLAKKAAKKEKESSRPDRTVKPPRETKKADPELESVAKEKDEKKKETSLEDVDAKLKSIIDNPDLNF